MVYEEVIPTTGQDLIPQQKPQTQSLDTLMAQIKSATTRPQVASMRAQLGTLFLTTFHCLRFTHCGWFGLCLGSSRNHGSKETVEYKEGNNVEICWDFSESAVQRNGWAHICWLYKYFEFDRNVGSVFARIFLLNIDYSLLANIDSVMTSSC